MLGRQSLLLDIHVQRGYLQSIPSSACRGFSAFRQVRVSGKLPKPYLQEDHLTMSPSLQVAVALEEPSAAEQDDRPEKPVCARCRSTEITFDATAWWDANQQQFRIRRSR